MEEFRLEDFNEHEEVPVIGRRFTAEETAAYRSRMEEHEGRRQALLEAAYNPQTGEYEF